MTTAPSANFYEVLLSKQERKIKLAGGADFRLFKFSFRQYVLINYLSRKFSNTEDLLEKLGIIFQLYESGIGSIDNFSNVGDAVFALNSLNEHNIIKNLYAFQAPQEFANEPEKDPVDYDGREIIQTVTFLSEHFGFEPEYILDRLCYEEVSAYMQEAMIRKFEKEEFDYNLAQVGYRDIGSKNEPKWEKIPYTPPKWMRMAQINDIKTRKENMTQEQKDAMEWFLPNGVVISLEDEWNKQQGK